MTKLFFVLCATLVVIALNPISVLAQKFPQDKPVKDPNLTPKMANLAALNATAGDYLHDNRTGNYSVNSTISVKNMGFIASGKYTIKVYIHVDGITDTPAKVLYVGNNASSTYKNNTFSCNSLNAGGSETFTVTVQAPYFAGTQFYVKFVIEPTEPDIDLNNNTVLSQKIVTFG